MNLLDSKPATEPQLRRIAVAVQQFCQETEPEGAPPQLAEIIAWLRALDKLRIEVLLA